MEKAIELKDLMERFCNVYTTYDLACKEAEELLDDYYFMEGLMKRMTKKKTGLVSLGLQINLPGLIYDKFVKDLFKNLCLNSKTVKDDLAERLYAFYCTKGVFKGLNASPNDMLLHDLILLEGYFQWMEGIDLLDYIGCFVGCSSQCTYIEELIAKMKEASE